jgi:hypothetical protein
MPDSPAARSSGSAWADERPPPANQAGKEQILRDRPKLSRIRRVPGPSLVQADRRAAPIHASVEASNCNERRGPNSTPCRRRRTQPLSPDQAGQQNQSASQKPQRARFRRLHGAVADGQSSLIEKIENSAALIGPRVVERAFLKSENRCSKMTIIKNQQVAKKGDLRLQLYHRKRPSQTICARTQLRSVQVVKRRRRNKARSRGVGKPDACSVEGCARKRIGNGISFGDRNKRNTSEQRNASKTQNRGWLDG